MKRRIVCLVGLIWTGIKLAKADAISQILSELDKLKTEGKKFTIKTNKFNQNLLA